MDSDSDLDLDLDLDLDIDSGLADDIDIDKLMEEYYYNNSNDENKNADDTILKEIETNELESELLDSENKDIKGILINQDDIRVIDKETLLKPSKYANDTIINDCTLYKQDVSANYRLDLLGIFNNFELDHSVFMMKLYSDSTVYPAIKIYKEYINEENINQLTHYMKNKSDTHSSIENNIISIAMLGSEKIKFDNSYDMMNQGIIYNKIKFKIKIKDPFTNDIISGNILNRNDLVLNLTLGNNGSCQLNANIRNAYSVTVDDLKEIIATNVNNFLKKIESLRSYSLAKEQTITMDTFQIINKNFNFFDPDNLDPDSEFFDIQINLITKADSLNKLYTCVKQGKIGFIRNMIKPKTKTCSFSLPYTEEETRIPRKRNIIRKRIDRAIYNNRTKEFLPDKYFNALKTWALKWISDSGYTSILPYVELSFKIAEAKLGKQQRLQKPEDIKRVYTIAKFDIVKAFGLTARVHIDKIIVYGVNTITEIYEIQHKIEDVFKTIKTMKIKVDANDLPVQNTAHTSEESEDIRDVLISFDDDNSFESHSLIEEYELEVIDYELEINNELIKVINDKKSYTPLSLLKTTDESFQNKQLNYGKYCQKNKPTFLLASEYNELIDILRKKREDTTSGDPSSYDRYIAGVLQNAVQIQGNTAVYYICTYAYDSINHEILDPYKLIIKENDTFYYIPDLDTSNAMTFPKGIITKESTVTKPKTPNFHGIETNMVYTCPITNEKYPVTLLKKPRYIINKNIKTDVPEVPKCEIKPDIQLPCCFFRSMNNNRDNESSTVYHARQDNEYVYNPNKPDNVNRPAKLPIELHTLLNNSTNYRENTYKYIRTSVYRGSFIHCFDPLLTTAHNVSYEDYNTLWFSLFDTLSDDDFENTKMGLLKVVFETKENFINYCKNNIDIIDETLLWELVPKLVANSDLLKKVNSEEELSGSKGYKLKPKEYTTDSSFWIFILQKNAAGVYSIVYPRGFNIRHVYNKISGGSPRFSILLYKYKNSENMPVYERIETVNNNENVIMANFFIDNKKQFIIDIVNLLYSESFDQITGRILNANEYSVMIEMLKDVSQFRELTPEMYTINSLGYITGCVLKNGMPLVFYPNVYSEFPKDRIISALPLKSKSEVDSFMKSLKEFAEHIKYKYLAMFAKVQGYVYSDDNRYIIGYILPGKIYYYFKPELSNLSLELPSDIKVYTQMYNLRDPFENISNEVIDLFTGDKEYLDNKRYIESLVYAIEYTLSEKMTNKERSELFDLIKAWDLSVSKESETGRDISLAQHVQDYIVNFMDQYVSIGSHSVNDFKNNEYKQCLPKGNNGCKIDISLEIYQSIIHWLVERILNPFDSKRFAILYKTVNQTNNISNTGVIQDTPKNSLLIDEQTLFDAITKLVRRCRKKTSIEPKLELLYGLTQTTYLDNTLKAVTISSLTNKVNTRNYERINVFENVFFFRSSSDFTPYNYIILQMALNKSKLTTDRFKLELYKLLKMFEIIPGPTGNQNYGLLLTNYFNNFIAKGNKELKVRSFKELTDIMTTHYWDFNYIDTLLLPFFDFDVQPMFWRLKINTRVDLAEPGDYSLSYYKANTDLTPVDIGKGYQTNNPLTCETLIENGKIENGLYNSVSNVNIVFLEYIDDTLQQKGKKLTNDPTIKFTVINKFLNSTDETIPKYIFNDLEMVDIYNKITPKAPVKTYEELKRVTSNNFDNDTMVSKFVLSNL